MNFLFLCFAILLAFLSSATGSAWDSLDFPQAVERAKALDKDVLAVYTAESMGSAGKHWRDHLLNDPAVARDLCDRFVLCHIVLPSKVASASIEAIRAVRMASTHGIGLLPTMILCDGEGRAYGRVLGGVQMDAEVGDLVEKIKKAGSRKAERDEFLKLARSRSGKEKEGLLLKALSSVPLSAWVSDYPDVMRQLESQGSKAILYQRALEVAQKKKLDERLSSLIVRASIASSMADVERYLGEIDQVLKDLSVTGATRQFVLLNGRYPLLVKKARLYYDGAVTMPCEEAFNKSVKTLEEIRDMDQKSYWGKEANRIREELRSARLSAARFD